MFKQVLFFILPVLLLINFSIFAQHRAEKLYEESNTCFDNSDYDCVVIKLEEILSSSEHDAFSEDFILKVYQKITESYYQLGDFQNTLKYVEKSLSLTSGDYKPFYYAEAKKVKAHVLWRKGENVASINEILESIKSFEHLHDTSKIIESSNILAGIYVSIADYKEAENIYEKMLQIALERNDSAKIAENYEYKGIVKFFDGKFDSAIYYYDESLKINQKLQKPIESSINFANIGEAYFKMNNYVQASNYLLKAIELQKEYSFNSGLIFSLFTLGNVYTNQNEYDSGQYYYDQSIELMYETGETRELQLVYMLKSENFAKRGDFESAYLAYKTHTQQKDSIFNLEKDGQLNEIRAQYNLEKKENENLLLRLQNEETSLEIEAKQRLINYQFIFVGFILIFLIVSVVLAIKLNRAKHTLTVANKSKDKLFGIIAHDLKGPIKNIDTMLKLLKNEKEESMKSEYFKYLDQTVHNLIDLTNQLLSWTFSNKGDFNFNIKNLDLKSVSKDTVGLFEYELSSKNISVENSIPEEIKVLADENALLTIFRNILSNAIKFTKNGGNINLTAEPKDDSVQIIISDSGIGMSTNAIEKALQGKHVNSSSGTANEKGSGLGFSIIIEFVKKLNGSLDIKSDPNTGTKVMLQLPKVK